MSKVNAVINQISSLNKTELKQVSEKLLQMLKEASGVACVSSDFVDNCRKCDSEHIVKFGKDKNGKQRYKCKSCGTTFTETSYSVVSKSHCSLDTWEKYIELLLDSASLERCAKECNISVRTAFIWRHKILNAMQKDQSNRCLAGIIEVDELYVSVSYKGNHKKSKKFTMPRAPYRRGGDNMVRTERKACVVCAVERNGQTYAETVGTGQPTIRMLKHSFNERLLPDSLVISDKSIGLRNYFNNHTSLELVQLLSKKERNKRHSPPQVKGIYHVQTVNSLHKRFRTFIRKYNGVSTKYLNHYIGLFIWLENYKKINNVDIKKEAKEYMCSKDTYINRNSLFDMPAIPYVA